PLPQDRGGAAQRSDRLRLAPRPRRRRRARGVTTAPFVPGLPSSAAARISAATDARGIGGFPPNGARIPPGVGGSHGSRAPARRSTLEAVGGTGGRDG